jgi:hypothetical protein
MLRTASRIGGSIVEREVLVTKAVVDAVDHHGHPLYLGPFGAMFSPGKGGAATKFSRDFGLGLKWAIAMFDDARFDTRHARDVLGARFGTSAVLAGLVSAKTREWTTLRRH